MKKASRILAVVIVVLTVLVMCTAYFTALAAGAEPTITVTPSNARLCRGDELVLTVEMNNNPGVCFLNFSIKINSDVLEYVGTSMKGCVLTNTMAPGYWNENESAFKYNHVNDNFLADFKGNGKLAIITFRVKDNAQFGNYTAPFVLDEANTFNAAQEPVHFKGVGAAFSVACIHIKNESVIKPDNSTAKAPTCTESGREADKVCTACGQTIATGSVIPALGHNMQEVPGSKKEPTCTEGGYTGDAVCTRCGKTAKGSEIPATGHTPDDKLKGAVEATCKKAGYTGDTVCKSCGTVIKKGKVIPVTDHVASDKLKGTVEATCEKEGYTGDTVCKFCGTVIKHGKATSKVKHSPAEERKGVKAATCTEEGYTGDIVCKFCGDVIEAGKTTPVDENAHVTEIKNKKDASCCEGGYTGDVVCKLCGTVIEAGKATPVDESAHVTEIKNKKDASCKEDGYTGDEVCAVCGKTIKAGSTIAKADHTYENGVCTVCGSASPSTSDTASTTDDKAETDPHVDETQAPADDDGKNGNNRGDKSGCGLYLGVAAALILLTSILVCALIMKRRKAKALEGADAPDSTK